MANAQWLKARRRRRVAAAAALAVVGTAAGLITETVTSGQKGYVTALVGSAPVSKTLSLTGTVQPADQAAADFQVAGTVSSVNVSAGQTVTAGQQLATLTSTALQESVTSAQANLAAAQAKLTEDELNQSTSSSGQAQTTAATTGETGGVVLVASVSPNPLAAEQQVVVKAQHSADMDMQSAGADLSQVQTACQGDTNTSPPSNPATSGDGSTTTTTTTTTTTPTSDSTDTSSGSTPSTTSTTSPSTTGSGSGSDSSCASALSQAAAAETQVQKDQQSVATAETQLADALAAEAKSSTGSPTPHTGTGSGSSTFSGSKSTSGSPAPTSGTKGSGASTPVNTDTPQQLATDQASIDSDQATLVVAQQDLTNAVLTAPISGTVVSVGLAPGQTVSSGSSSDTVEIISSGTYVAQATLTTAQVAEVSLGEQAQVAVNGMTGSFLAKVTRVGPVTQSNGSYVYPLVAALASTGTGIPSGSDTEITVDLASAQDAMVVPTSAVHTTNAGSYVLLDKDGKEVEQRVTVGVVGTEYSQITSGLTSGQSVILADRSQALPSSSTNQTNTRLGLLQGSGATQFRIGGAGGGGFAGGGFAGGGFAGGGGGGGLSGGG